jgi:hypothetical protein
MDSLRKQLPHSRSQDIRKWILDLVGQTEWTTLLCSFMAYRSPREVLADSTPASIHRLSHSVITQFSA